MSQKEGNSFPMAVTGFHFTLACIRGLRAGHFDRVCLRQGIGGVSGTMATLYVGMFLKFYNGWKVRRFKDRIESIQNFNPFKDEVINSVTKRPAAALVSVDQYK